MSGLTLIELLVAAAVSFVVLATALLLYTSAVGRVARRDPAGRRQEASIALAVIERDINCAVAVHGGVTQEVFVLAPGSRSDKKSLELKFFTAAPAGSGGLLSVYDVLEVGYKLEHDKAGFYRFVRSARPFRPGAELEAYVSETLCGHVGAVVMEVSDGVSWTNEWRAFASDPVPAAATVKIFLAGQADPSETWTLIPAGIDLKKEK